MILGDGHHRGRVGSLSQPVEGDFVELRGRPWLVDGRGGDAKGFETLKLSSVADDSQGEALEIIWDAEVGASIIDDAGWESVGVGGPDSAEVLAAHVRAVRWKSATAADRDLLQAPFRAGIRLDAYQLLPLRKALRLPRVNLLIADDVGLGKTIEAGLIVRELLLRKRADFIVVAAPPSMTAQWKDELETKFGLSFDIIDRERFGDLRRERGFSVNPWNTGSRFIVSHRLLVDETYSGLLRDALGEFRARALFILDEAHHAAPSAGTRYAVSSQLTRAIRDLAERFEHRLFLTATPHNGHSNSFTALLEMLDPQRFERGTEVRPRDLEPVMVRRLKSDLRRLGAAFPERVIEPIVVADLPDDAPELDLARRLTAYGALRLNRIATLPPGKATLAKLVFVGLQQRLLSSIAAFARTLRAHRRGLVRLIEHEAEAHPSAAAVRFVAAKTGEDVAELDLEDTDAEAMADAEEESLAEAATASGAEGASVGDLAAELERVDEMLAIAEHAAAKPDARVAWLIQWVRANLMVPSGAWNDRRLIVFTEYEDTRRWLERRLREVFDETPGGEARIGVFTGATSTDRREAVKRAFNADPAQEPLRILICTDAAREGINLQSRCADLVHFDLPWNPARLEQRNGRIDRKLQPSPRIYCRYFRYEQREADIVLEALVRKTETIREELGSFGKVIEDRVAAKLAEDGILAGQAGALARMVASENDAERLATARAEMDDETEARHRRLLREEDDLRRALERSRERVGVDPDDLRRVAAAALSRAGVSLDDAAAAPIGKVATFQLEPGQFAGDSGWEGAFDDLRVRPRKRGERVGDWRRAAPVRSISFEPPILSDGRDADGVVQVHLEHRLVRRLIARFLSQGFQSKLSRLSVIVGPGAQPRLVLMGRLAVFGEAAARLHEEIIRITAIWTEADRDKRPLRPLGDSGEEKTLGQLQEALNDASEAPPLAVARIRPWLARDIADLVPRLREIAAERLADVSASLVKRGEEEANNLTSLLEQQRARIGRAVKDFDPAQQSLDLWLEDERRERQANARYWRQRLMRLETELAKEPDRLRRAYDVRAHRLEPVGLVYLWPASG